MNTIKFSHNYPKLPQEGVATLLQAVKVGFSELSPTMLTFDTTFEEGGKSGTYELPKGELILLLFLSPQRVLFTTIRRYTPSKWEYYKANEGKEFKVEIAYTAVS